MNPQTFRHWLAERGCTFEETEHERGKGVAEIVVRRGPKRAVMPLSASRKDLPEESVRAIVDELGLPYHELPGPQSRR